MGCSSGLIMFSLIYRHPMRCYTSGLPSCIVGSLNPVTRKCNAVSVALNWSNGQMRRCLRGPKVVKCDAVCVALNWSNATLFAWP
jgi:hypothetical protein